MADFSSLPFGHTVHASCTRRARIFAGAALAAPPHLSILLPGPHFPAAYGPPLEPSHLTYHTRTLSPRAWRRNLLVSVRLSGLYL